MSKTVLFESDIGRKYQIGSTTVNVEELLAEGGFSVVFLAKTSGGQKYALKRMYVMDEARLQACKREIQIMSNLSNHKNMITYVDSLIARDYKGVYEILILMEYCPDTCMKMLNERGSSGFKEQEALKVFCDVCEAVSRLHHCQTPIMHRDLKIENILRDSSGNFVLCDFGSATARFYIPGKDERSLSDVEEDINKHTTLSHRAPEMVNLYSHSSITTKADIWALGVTLYRLCFRSLPFGESTLAIQSANFNIPENSPYSQGLHALIYYCLEPEQDKRPDIFQVCHFAFHLAERKSPVKNIHGSSIPNPERLIAAMEGRNSKLSRALTPRAADRGDRIEKTTVTPRERPKPGRTAAPPPPAQRRLVPEGLQASNVHPSVPSAVTPSAPPAAGVIHQQQLQQQQLFAQHQLQHDQLQQQLMQQQRMQEDQYQLQQEQLQLQRIQAEQLYAVQPLQYDPRLVQQMQQQALQQPIPQMFVQLATPRRLPPMHPEYSASLHTPGKSAQESLTGNPFPVEPTQDVASWDGQQMFHRSSHPNVPERREVSNNPFDSGFGKAPTIKAAADLSLRHVASGPLSEPVEQFADFSAFDEKVKQPDDPPSHEPAPSFELSPVHAERKQQPFSPTASHTSSARGHRRNVSDTSAISIGKGSSAFKPYSSLKTKHFAVSLQALSSATSPSVACPRSKSELLSQANQSFGPVKSASAEALSSDSWNPFGNDYDSISDDAMFGKEFDRLRSGSQSSIQNVKSREDLVMAERDSSGDPFSAAPFNSAKGKDKGNKKQGSDKYSRLKRASSHDNLLKPEVPRSQNATIFGLPIPFTKRTDRTDKYQKVPIDYTSDDSRSLGDHLDKQSHSSDSDDPLDNTLNAPGYRRLSDEDGDQVSSAPTWTTNSLDKRAVDGRGKNEDVDNSSNYSSTLSPPHSSTENLAVEQDGDPFGAAPFNKLKSSKKKGSGYNTAPELVQRLGNNKVQAQFLSGNPFLPDVNRLQLADRSVAITSQSDPKLMRKREPSFSEFASERCDDSSVSTGSTAQIVDRSQQQQQSLSKETTANAFAEQGSLPRIPKSKTTEGLWSGTLAVNDLSDSDVNSMKRSHTTYELTTREHSSPEVDESSSLNKEKSESDNLLVEDVTKRNSAGSMRKKEKGRKSPRSKTKSPRASGTKKSLTCGDSDDEAEVYTVALTNEAFCEQESASSPPCVDDPPSHLGPPILPKPSAEVSTENQTPHCAQKTASLKKQAPAPPVKPPRLIKEAPVQAAMSADFVNEFKPTPTTSQQSVKSNNAGQQADNSNVFKKPPVTLPKPTSAKLTTSNDPTSPTPDFYKTHKRYSSYDIATGRAEPFAHDDDGKSALVKDSKTKKKNKIGLF